MSLTKVKQIFRNSESAARRTIADAIRSDIVDISNSEHGNHVKSQMEYSCIECAQNNSFLGRATGSRHLTRRFTSIFARSRGSHPSHLNGKVRVQGCDARISCPPRVGKGQDRGRNVSQPTLDRQRSAWRAFISSIAHNTLQSNDIQSCRTMFGSISFLTDLPDIGNSSFFVYRGAS